MSAMDLHPEDLLDREMLDELSFEERARLELHLRQCAVCRFERLVREDFRLEAETVDPEVHARNLVSSLTTPTSSSLSNRKSSEWPRLRRHRVVLLVAAAITMAGAAAAAGVRAMAGWGVPRTTIVAREPAARVEGAVRGGVVRPALPLQAPAPEAMSVATENTTALAAPVPAGPRRSRPVRVAEVALAPSSATGAGEIMNPSPAPLATPDATTLFDRATDARRSGDHAGAARFYGELIERYPSAPEAHESYAVLGRMLLDDGDAEGALVCFERYLPTGVALEEDVMLGKALALRRLGRNDDELRAWSALLERYPGSVHAQRANARLLELRKR